MANAVKKMVTDFDFKVHADEFVAADTEGRVTEACVGSPANIYLQCGCEFPDERVAGGVALLIVNLFEAVEIPGNK